MEETYFEYNMLRGERPERSDSPQSESNYSEISIATGLSSFSEISVLSCSSSKSWKLCKRSYPPLKRTSTFKVSRPNLRPSSYFGNSRGDQNILHVKPKTEISYSAPCENHSGPSPSMPPLISTSITPVNLSPGPSWTNFPDSKPFIPFKKKPFMTKSYDCTKQSGLEMAVRHSSPYGKLTEHQGKFIQSQLIEALDKTAKKRSPPSFLKSFFDQGVFWIICADEKSKEWLIEHVKQLSGFWKDLDLIVEAAKFPKRPIVYVDLPELQKSLEVLERLASQNNGLRTEGWSVLNCHTFKSRQRVTFSIDMDSFEYLKARNFKVTWKLQSVTFKVPSKANKGHPGSSIKGRPGPH